MLELHLKTLSFSVHSHPNHSKAITPKHPNSPVHSNPREVGAGGRPQPLGVDPWSSWHVGLMFFLANEGKPASFDVDDSNFRG